MVNKRLIAISAVSKLIRQHLNIARTNARKNYAFHLSEELKNLSNHIISQDLNTVKAVELIRQFAEDIKSVSEEQY